MCNEKEERIKSEIGALMPMAAPAGAYQFKVEFEFLEDYSCLNQFAEDLGRCVSNVKRPSYNFRDNRYGDMQIEFQERENRFITKLLNLIANQNTLHRPRCVVKIKQLQNDMKTVVQTDYYTVQFVDVDMPCLFYQRDGQRPEEFILLTLQVHEHTGDMHKVEFTEKKQNLNQDGPILDGQ